MGGSADIDAYIQITGGSPAIQGETTDATLGVTKAIQVLSFKLGGTTDLEKDFEKRYIQHQKDLESAASPFGGLIHYDPNEDDDDDDGDEGDAAKSVRQFEFDKLVDASSPALFQAYCSTSRSNADGGPFRYETAVVTIRRAGSATGFTFLEFTFSDLYVSSYTFSTKEGEPPEEKVKLYFRKCQFKYIPQKADGSADSPVMLEFAFA